MVALNESIFHHPGAHGLNSGTAAQRGRSRCRAFAPSVRYVGSGRSGSSVSNNLLVNSNYDVLYRRRQIIEAATSAVIASWQFIGPIRVAEVALGNGIIQTMLNNARTNSAVQSPTPVSPPWGDNTTDRLGYDGSGQMITKRYLTGGINSTTFAYNNTTALVGNTTAYDRAGNKFYERALQAEERDNLYQPVDGSGNIASPAPGYDSVNRLLQYQRGTLASTGGYQNAGGGSIATPITLPNTDQSRNYTLDGLGNWKNTTFNPTGQVVTVTDSRNHNYVNQITQVTETPPGAVTAFHYDGQPGASNGNLENDGTLIYAYDALNRPVQISRVSDGLVIATYVYDAMNRRARKTVTNGGLTGNIPNGTTDYIWLGSQVLEERNSSNAPIRQYVWGTYIDECIELTTFVALGSQNLEPGTYYLLQDLLYRAAALTNSSGAIVEAYDTDAYGNTLIFTAPGPDGVWFTDDDVQSSYGANEITYCGYRYDPESELYYLRNRSYNSVLGRWLQRDPVGYFGGVNLYEYVGGRALTEVDAEGNAPMPIVGAPPGQPNWLQYVHTCQTATAGYGSGCNSEKKGCKGPVQPWPCCAQGVSAVICGFIRAAYVAYLHGIVLRSGTIAINGIPFPADPCFLGCVNWCLYQHWSAKPAAPDWKAADATCGKCGNCSAKCCQSSVASEQRQLSACAAGCGTHCGTPNATVAKLIQLQAQRIKLGVTLCCGH